MQEISAAELQQEMADGQVVLLDVREDDEVAVSILPGAIHIPMNSVPSRVGELDPLKPTVVICRAGARSAKVAEFLVDYGFQQVFNLTGGMKSWAQNIDPKLPVA
jgi:rhodanese-related sulfurtransferase